MPSFIFVHVLLKLGVFSDMFHIGRWERVGIYHLMVTWVMVSVSKWWSSD